jgi:patatin-like phospholipase/acyl hydrolase
MNWEVIMSYCILSFCGGGIRGMLSSGYLNRLAEAFPTIISRADLLAGTSTGADIISMILADKTAAQIYESYINAAPLMFKDPKTDPKHPAYDVTELVAAQLLLHKGNNPPLSQVPRSVLFTSFNVGKERVRWEPLLFNNMPNSMSSETPLVDAVVSSSAMPGMYGSHKGNVDGAFVNHDPTLAAIALAVSAGHDLNDISVICFGTGFMANWIASDTANWGAEQWQENDGSPFNRIPPLLINGSKSPILNMLMNGTSTNLIPQLSGMLLGPRYAYMNATLDKIIPENDTNPADLKYMQSLVASADITAPLSVLANYWR